MGKIYLIDFENVSSSGFTGIDELSRDDSVHVFYGHNCNKISFDIHKLLTRSRAKMDFLQVTTGYTNALDFQLSTYLGYLVANLKEHETLYVVSNDTGYDHIISFWQATKGITRIRRVPNIANHVVATSSTKGLMTEKKQIYHNYTHKETNLEDIKKENDLIIEKEKISNWDNVFHVIEPYKSNISVVDLTELKRFINNDCKNQTFNLLTKILKYKKGKSVYDTIKNTIWR